MWVLDSESSPPQANVASTWSTNLSFQPQGIIFYCGFQEMTWKMGHLPYHRDEIPKSFLLAICSLKFPCWQTTEHPTHLSSTVPPSISAHVFSEVLVTVPALQRPLQACVSWVQPGQPHSDTHIGKQSSQRRGAVSLDGKTQGSLTDQRFGLFFFPYLLQTSVSSTYLQNTVKHKTTHKQEWVCMNTCTLLSCLLTIHGLHIQILGEGLRFLWLILHIES